MFQIFKEAYESGQRYINGTTGSDALVSDAVGGVEFMLRLKDLFYRRGFRSAEIEDYYFDTKTWKFLRKKNVKDVNGAGAGGNKRGRSDSEVEQERVDKPRTPVGDDDDNEGEGAAASARKKQKRKLWEMMQRLSLRHPRFANLRF